MQLLPLIYFLLLFIYIYKKRGFDVSAYVTLLYVITSGFSYLSYVMGYIDYKHSNINPFTGILYCGLITAAIVPLYKLNFNAKSIRVNDKIINYLTYGYFVIFVIFMLLQYKNIIFVLTFGDFADLRKQIILTGHIDGIKGVGAYRFIFTIINILAGGSFIMILLFFVSLCYCRRKWYFYLMMLLGSSTSLFLHILNIDRSGSFYYVVFFGLGLVMFWNKFSTWMKAKLIPIISTLFVGICIYFMAVSSDRFENSNQGVNGGLITYAGQPYTNFCYFFDNYNNPNGISTCYLLPFTNYLISGYQGGVQREVEQEEAQSLLCNVFMTFLGSFTMDCNQFAPFVFILIYLSLFKIRKIRQKSLSMSSLFFVFILASIPACGCISYYYVVPYTNFMIFLLICFCNIMDKRKIS